MQLSQSLQWVDLNGLAILQVRHILVVLNTPLCTILIGNSWHPKQFSFLFIIPGSIVPVIHIIINSNKFSNKGIIITATVKLDFKNYK